MQKKLILSLLFISLAFRSIADEGMWLLLMLGRKYDDMKKMGLKLKPEDIYSINQSSLKDAIVRFGTGFCTGEVISKDGLVLTNHHCAYSSIQSHSTPEKDYLSGGFWAMQRPDELQNEALTISFLVRMEDVTGKVNAQLTEGMSEQERQAKIQAVFEEIKTETSKAEKAKGNDYEVEVKSFFEGNEFYMLLYETYKDIRLVGAPPESIGKFGGDTDNWMWPRHTGDFSLFRIYTDKNGKPAEYAPDNIPLKPKHHFPVSLNGVQPNDFAMVFGFPGNTERYLTSFGVKLAIEEKNPTVVAIRDKILKIMKEDMDKSKDIRIKYASKYAKISNYWKYFIGQTEGLKRLNVYEQKQSLEKAFQAWADADPTRKTKYGNVLKDMAEAYEVKRKYEPVGIYVNEAVFAPEIVPLAYQFFMFLQTMNGGDKTEIEKQSKELKQKIEEHFKDFNLAIDKKMMVAVYQMMYDKLDKELLPPLLKEVPQKYGSFQTFVDSVYAKTVFASESKMEDFFKTPNPELLMKDPAIEIMLSTLRTFFSLPKNHEEKLDKANRLFIAGLREMNPDKMYYPDANSTPRLTYGKVGSYQPKDAVEYLYYTTLEGIIEKEDPENAEFIVPAKLKTLYENKDFGRYAWNGMLPVCFITNNDITGGNSGSPVINGDGHIIGCAFDGNWEAMSGDIAFDAQLKRCISVDIRYVLFIIDKFAGAGHLVQEMTIVEGGANVKKKKEKKK